MTAEDIRHGLEAWYANVIAQAGCTYGAKVPAGVTPLSWDIKIPDDARGMSRSEFGERYAEKFGRMLASAGLLAYDLDTFAAIRVQDRDYVQVRGNTKTHKRERAFIVHALGWKGESK